MVAGGPYGLEEIVQKAGYRDAIAILLLVPIVWSVPAALMVAELGSSIPEEGGYYAWVRRALGPFWGFQEAWLSLVASVFDMAIYPTLFVCYLGRLFPSVATGWPSIVLGVGMIAICAAWNVRGSRALGLAVILGGIVCAVGMFNALVMSYSRVPLALATDGFLPKIVARLHPRSGAPWVAILLCAVAYASSLGLGFDRLVELDVLLYGL